MSLRKDRPPSGRSNVADRPSTAQNSSRPLTSARPSTARDKPALKDSPSLPRPTSARQPMASPRPMFKQKQSSSNLQSKPETTSPANSGRLSSRQLHSARPTTASGRLSASEELTSEEVMRRLTDKAQGEERQKKRAAIADLPAYNQYSRPKPSQDAPLRSVLLDPSVNNIPKSKTRTEFLKKVKYGADPHPSYDVDGDGWVSQEDYAIAKRFDLNGNGVLDPSEIEIAKRILADEFFKKHESSLHLFGDKFVHNSHHQNVDWLVNSYSFERTYNRLKSTERTLEASTSKKIADAMSLKDDSLTKFNYYTNKFDTTAWNDFDRIPRSLTAYAPKQSSVGVLTRETLPANNPLFEVTTAPSMSTYAKSKRTASYNLFGDNANHGGSRNRLLFSRKQETIEGNQMKLDIADSKKPPGMPTRRMNLITNVEIENGR